MKSRYWRFFQEDNKTIIMAFDHGGGGRIPVDDPGKVISDAVKGGIDGILTTYGIAKNFRKEIGKAGLMLRIDAGGSALAPSRRLPRARYAIEDALRLGADGIMCMGVVGVEEDPEYMQLVADTAAACDKWGLLAAGEMTPNSVAYSPDLASRPPEKMKVACRVAGELGLDLIKTQYIPPVESFKTVVANTYLPIVALGGPANPDSRVVLAYIREAMDAGCFGVAVGRNIWNHPNVTGFVSAIRKIVHEDADVDTAIKELE
jgi:DhnA family fructose-bisphosphate aldolase class Ia